MKIAAQTILYGSYVKDWSLVLNELKSIGFQGFELFQSPTMLSPGFLNIDDVSDKKIHYGSIKKALEGSQLTMCGLAGGVLEHRVQLIENLEGVIGSQLPYLYIEDWNSKIESFVLKHPELRFGLHPHISRNIETYEDALTVVRGHHNVFFMPDTAHLGIKSPCLFEMIKSNSADIETIHLKDWHHRFGKSRITYARGFSELGKGSLDLDELREWILEEYSGWVVIEQDYSNLAPGESLKRSLEWLQTGRISPRKSFAQDAHFPTVSKDIKIDRILALFEGCSSGTQRFYDTACEFAARYFECGTVVLWEVNSKRHFHTRVAQWPMVDGVFQQESHPFGIGYMDRSISSRMPLVDRETGEGGQREYFIPIFNHCNPNDPLLVFQLKNFGANGTIPLSECSQFQKFIAHLLQKFWTSLIAEAREEFSKNYDAAETMEDFLEGVCSGVLRKLECSFVDVWVVSKDSSQLELRGSSAMKATGSSIFSDDSREGPTLVFSPLGKNNEVVSLSADEGLCSIFKRGGDCNFRCKELDGLRNALARTRVVYKKGGLLVDTISILDGGEQKLGLIVCGAKHHNIPDSQFDFSLSDELFLSAVESGIGSYLNTLLDRERRDMAFRFLRHEVKNPLTYLKNSIRLLRESLKLSEMSESERGQFNLGHSTFSEDRNGERKKFISDSLSYLKLIKVVVDRSYALRSISAGELNLSRVVFNDDFFMGPINDISGYVRKRRQSYHRLKKRELSFKYEVVGTPGFSSIYADVDLFRGTIMNLLLNALKYYDSSSSEIRIQIEASYENGVKLVFRDWGIGIEDKFKDRVFDMGFRSPRDRASSSAGEGIGLWQSKKVCQLHGASIKVTHTYKPTEITIRFPLKVENLKWNENNNN